MPPNDRSFHVSKQTSLKCLYLRHDFTIEYPSINTITTHTRQDKMHTHNLLSLLATVLTVTALPQPHADAAIKPKDPAPTLDEFLSSPMTFEKRQSNTSTSSTSLPDATVQLCTQPDFKGECTNATWSVNQCIDLRGYAGVTESFLPGEGFECLLMQ